MTPSSPSKDPRSERDSQPDTVISANQANSAQSKQNAPVTGLPRTVQQGIIRIVCFFGLLVFLIYALNAMINIGLRRIQTGQFGVSNWIVEGKINADIIITGSSRAVSHYDPRIIESMTGLTAFNIGLNGSQTDMQLAVLKTYLQHNRKPRVVIHNLDAFSFVMTSEVYDPAQYMPYLDQPDLYAALHQINRDLWWKCKYMPLYGYAVNDMRLDWIQGLLGLLGWSPRQDFFRGFNPRAGRWTEDFAGFKAANPNGIRFDIQAVGVRVVEELIQTCHESGIVLIFVYSPEYAPMQSLTQNRTAIFDKFRKLSQPFNVPVWDFSNWKESDDTAVFVNSQHLNAEGAKIFSTDLARRLTDELPQLKTNVFTPSQPSR